MTVFQSFDFCLFLDQSEEAVQTKNGQAVETSVAEKADETAVVDKAVETAVADKPVKTPNIQGKGSCFLHL